jgi:hypothetical protein
VTTERDGWLLRGMGGYWEGCVALRELSGFRKDGSNADISQYL